jgi:serine-type D-Ala-D-Ala carboxypeptidase/endopeptidase (penicillin-binding protein 4)
VFSSDVLLVEKRKRFSTFDKKVVECGIIIKVFLALGSLPLKKIIGEKNMMSVSAVQKNLRFSVVTILWIGLAAVAHFAQPVYSRPAVQTSPTPFMQPIIIQSGQKAPSYPKPTPTPLIKITTDSGPTGVRKDVPSDTFLADNIPGYSGVLVETMDGKTVRDNYSNYAFNPASNVKILTTYAVLKTLGPNFRFPTNVYTDGTVDNMGNLIGNLYITGRNPAFNFEHAVEIAEALNKAGVRTVQGDMIVTDRFVMNFNESTDRSAQSLFATIDANKRSAAATRSWQAFLTSSGKFNQLSSIPSVSFTGGLYVDVIPSNVKMMFSHESAPLKEVVKVTMAYSNNFLAERLGDYVGGPSSVASICHQGAGIAPNELVIQTSSGLGINRVTPRAMMKVLRTLNKLLESNKMNFGDVMPIAGMDVGTLEHRFTQGFSRGSVVGKTGTLGNTDGGVSALSGMMNTRQGKLLFVIFNQRGGVPKFRNFQNNYVSQIQDEFGGAMPFGYTAIAFATRLANTKISYPASRPRN